jgi:hypothetical protein
MKYIDWKNLGVQQGWIIRENDKPKVAAPSAPQLTDQAKDLLIRRRLLGYGV